MFYGGVVRHGRRGRLCRPMLRHPFPLRDQLHDGRVENRVYSGIKRVVETEKGRERE
jgi:hypothetical protein